MNKLLRFLATLMLSFVLSAEEPQNKMSRPLLKNAGFEKKLSGWNASPLTKAESGRAHSGQYSAKLNITKIPQKRNDVYITRCVPVIAGANYKLEGWVRTENVVPKKIHGMSAAGATIIMEFADKNRKWLSGGSYAKGSYGTTPWQKLTTKTIRAPEKAGYAIIYLALRSFGTAWFDDIVLKEVSDNIILKYPGNGSVLKDNTPEFAWSNAPAGGTLELGRSADFAHPVVKLDLDISEASPISLPKPIAPGKWYWRIRNRRGTVSETRYFIQNAPVTKDCTPPQITPAHQYLPEPYSKVSIPVSDNTGIAKWSAKLDQRKVSLNLKDGILVYTPKQPWSQGPHILAINVSDTAGNSTSTRIFLNYAPGIKPRVWLREHGTERNGIRDFPQGIYGVPLSKKDMSVIADLGFKIIHSYAFDHKGNNTKALAYLNMAQSYGLSTFVAFDRSEIMAGNKNYVAERVMTLMHHPALYAWYLYDEPDLTKQYVHPKRLSSLYKLIKRLDPFHPVIVTCASVIYKDCCDVYWSQVYGDTRLVARKMSADQKNLKPPIAHVAITHCYDIDRWDAYKKGLKSMHRKTFRPTVKTMRANAFMALTKGSSGLFWWWWGQRWGRSWGCKTEMVTVRDDSAALAGLRAIIADIVSLKPVLTADGEVKVQVIKPADNVEIHVWEKKLADYTVIIAVNRDNTKCNVEITPKTNLQYNKIERLLEKGSITMRNGKITDEFKPLAVHVYKLTRQKSK